MKNNSRLPLFVAAFLLGTTLSVASGEPPTTDGILRFENERSAPQTFSMMRGAIHSPGPNTLCTETSVTRTWKGTRIWKCGVFYRMEAGISPVPSPCPAP